MSMRILKRGIIRLLAARGYSVTKTSGQGAAGTMDGAIRAIARRKHDFNTVVDVGASNGVWSEAMMKYLPSCGYLLIEAQSCHAEQLRQFGRKHANVRYVLAAAGEARGNIYFDASDPFGGQASRTPLAGNCIEVPVTTIDDEVRDRKLPGPYLIKLDTHGFELPILRGAFSALKETEVIIMECYNFRIAPECLLFYEMCSYLANLGFRCIDLVDPMYRPYDDSFWQMDLVFVRDNRPEFSYQRYR